MSLPQRKLTAGEYLDMERKASTRSEFLAGDVHAMSGADRRHDHIAVNVIAELRSQFKGRPCIVHSSDMRLKVSDTGLYTYPDASALCGEARYEDAHVDTLLNPALVVEVLSKSTEAYDRGAKFAHYRRVESLAEYLLISTGEVRVEHYARQPDGRWLLTEKTRLDDVLELACVGARLALAEVYDKVDLSRPEETPRDVG